MPYSWDPISKRFRDPKGRYIAEKTIRQLLDIAIDTRDVERITRAFFDGTISKEAWRDGMKALIKRSYIQAGLLAKGGKGQMTPAAWGSMGGNIAEQYYHLEQKFNNFFDSIEDLTEKQALARARMYVQSARQQFEEFMKEEKIDAGAVWEKWILGVAEHCPDCIDLSKLGRVPIGTLWTVPGAGETQCLTNCRCRIAYYSQSGRTLAEYMSLGSSKSGNYGHKGRPGKRGGSAPGGKVSPKMWANTLYNKKVAYYRPKPGEVLPDDVTSAELGIIAVSQDGKDVIVSKANLRHSVLLHALGIEREETDTYRRYRMNAGTIHTYTGTFADVGPFIDAADHDRKTERAMSRSIPSLVRVGFSPDTPFAWTTAEQSKIELKMEHFLSEELTTSEVISLLKGQAFSIYDSPMGTVFLIDEPHPDNHAWRKLGGPGSGHYGHKGVPGKRGGSAPSGGGLVGMSPEEALAELSLRANPDKRVPNLILDDGDAGNKWEYGSYAWNQHRIRLSPYASDHLRAYLGGDESDEARDIGLLTLAHELYHSQSPAAVPSRGFGGGGGTFEEGMVELKARQLVKEVTGQDVVKGNYGVQVKAVQFISDSFGSKMVDRLWEKDSIQKRDSLLVKPMRTWLAGTLVAKGATPGDAEWMAKQVKKPVAILKRHDWETFTDPNISLRQITRMLSVVQEYKVPVDWKNYEELSAKETLHKLSLPYEYDGAYHVFGGPGSGHFGHKGIPGHRGGSAPSGGGISGSILDHDLIWKSEESIVGHVTIETDEDPSEDDIVSFLKDNVPGEISYIRDSGDIEEIDIQDIERGSGYVRVKVDILPSVDAGNDWLDQTSGEEEWETYHPGE